jgi:predicted enzyme related to lactoylglutathione lyase
MFKDANAFSSFSTNDIEATRTFYSEVLGLDAGAAEMGVIKLTLPGGAIVMIYPKGEEHQPASFTVLNFQVNDVDAAVRELKEKGVTIERYDMPEIEQDENGIFRGKQKGSGPDIAWFTDPAGNILSVIEE